MYTITKLSKILVIAVFSTCIILMMYDRLPLSVLYNPYPKQNEEMNQHIPHLTAIQNNDSLIHSEVNESSLWINIGEQLNLKHSSQNPRVQMEIHKILADKSSFEAILNRSAPYIYYIYKQTQQRNLPVEISLIPIMESEYNPNDHNSIGAMGLWQLMPETAQSLGLKIGNGDRRNVIDSTNAALAFLTDLSKEFDGNWDLAFAAYNCGPGCVSSAIKKANSHNYFDLKLPQETELYVPRLLAIAHIIKHAKEYGIVLPQIKDAPYFTAVKINKEESLSSYAKSTGIDLGLLKKLNPDYQYKKVTLLSNTILVPLNSQTI